MSSTSPFPRLDVSTWTVYDVEQMGADEKWWLEDAADVRWLFKPAEIKQNGTRQGQDWAEKIAAEIAELLAIPHAHVELATWDGREGSLSRRIGADALVLREGSLHLMDRGAPEFVPFTQLPKGPAGKLRPGHSLRNIRDALENVDRPPECRLPAELTAFDVFVGYLLLDAWIANRDRHDQNWAVLEPQLGDAPRSLCPSYDHASALGYGLSDDDRDRHLADADSLRRFATKGNAWRFENEGPGTIPTLVSHAVTAMEMASPVGRQFWMTQVSRLPIAGAADVVRRVPGLSVPTRTFTGRLLEINAERLSHECNSRL